MAGLGSRQGASGDLSSRKVAPERRNNRVGCASVTAHPWGPETGMHELDNIFWNAMSGPQAPLAEGTERARRFARGFSPMLGFADPGHPAFEDVAPFCDPGEAFYTDGWAGPVP